MHSLRSVVAVTAKYEMATGNIEILLYVASSVNICWLRGTKNIFYPAGWRMVVLAMQYSDTRYGGTHSACAAPINIEAPWSGGWWWWWQLHQPRSSNKLSTLIIIILNPPASSWQWWSLGFRKGVKEVTQLLIQFRRFRQLEIFLCLV